MSKLVKTGLSFAAGGLLIHLSHGWGKPVDLFCTPPALPACGTGDEAPSAPPLASVPAVTSTSGTLTMSVFIDAVTDEEHSIPPTPLASISGRS